MTSIKLPPLFYATPRNSILAVGLPLAIGFSSGLFTQNSTKNWYSKLEKPPGEPAGVIFPFFWTTFYAGMGLSTHLIIKAFDSAPVDSNLRTTADLALKLHYTQYGLNLLWSPLFFGANLVGASLVNSTLLTGTAFASAYYAAKVDKRTLYCLVPYTLWIGYAQYLHMGVWYLNFSESGRKNAIARGARRRN